MMILHSLSRSRSSVRIPRFHPICLKIDIIAHSGITGLFNHCHLKASSVPNLTTTDNSAYSRRLKVASYAQEIHKKRQLARSISSKWDLMPVNAQKGMRNLTGSLCYRNSLLQAIIHSPKVAHWLRTFHRPEQCE